MPDRREECSTSRARCGGTGISGGDLGRDSGQVVDAALVEEPPSGGEGLGGIEHEEHEDLGFAGCMCYSPGMMMPRTSKTVRSIGWGSALLCLLLLLLAIVRGPKTYTIDCSQRWERTYRDVEATVIPWRASKLFLQVKGHMNGKGTLGISTGTGGFGNGQAVTVGPGDVELNLDRNEWWCPRCYIWYQPNNGETCTLDVTVDIDRPSHSRRTGRSRSNKSL